MKRQARFLRYHYDQRYPSLPTDFNSKLSRNRAQQIPDSANKPDDVSELSIDFLRSLKLFGHQVYQNGQSSAKASTKTASYHISEEYVSVRSGIKCCYESTIRSFWHLNQWVSREERMNVSLLKLSTEGLLWRYLMNDHFACFTRGPRSRRSGSRKATTNRNRCRVSNVPSRIR